MALKECPTHYLADLPIPEDLRFKAERLVRIVPGTLDVTATGVFGAPVGHAEEAQDAVDTVPEISAPTTTDSNLSIPDTAPTQPQSVTAIPVSGADISTSLGALIAHLAAGLKLTITVELTK